MKAKTVSECLESYLEECLIADINSEDNDKSIIALNYVVAKLNARYQKKALAKNCAQR